MQKRKREPHPSASFLSERQLVGLREYAQTQKQKTVERLTTAITSLSAQHKPISARTIREESGLEYATIRRNPEALRLYQQSSTYLLARSKHKKAPTQSKTMQHDPLLAYKKVQLVTRLHEEQAKCRELETQQATLLEDAIQRDIKIAKLEAELAGYRDYFERLRMTIQPQEHQG